MLLKTALSEKISICAAAAHVSADILTFDKFSQVIYYHLQ